MLGGVGIGQHGSYRIRSAEEFWERWRIEHDHDPEGVCKTARRRDRKQAADHKFLPPDEEAEQCDSNQTQK